MIKSWFHGQSGRLLVIFDQQSIVCRSQLFLPVALCLDVITTTRSSRAQEMAALEAVEADMNVLI
jgi:hypothetical protein